MAERLAGGNTHGSIVRVADTVRRPSLRRDSIGPDVIDVCVERCAREADLISSLGAAGEEPYCRLLADGHHAIWTSAAEHVAARGGEWRDALSRAG